MLMKDFYMLFWLRTIYNFSYNYYFVLDAVDGQKNKFGVDGIESAIKLWLKHAPGRVLKSNQQLENNNQIILDNNNDINM